MIVISMPMAEVGLPKAVTATPSATNKMCFQLLIVKLPIAKITINIPVSASELSLGVASQLNVVNRCKELVTTIRK